MKTFPNRRVWHSQLRKASPLVIRFTSDVQESKYESGQKIVFFEVRGDSGNDYYLQIEPEDAEQLVQRINSVPQRQWVTVRATSEYDEDSEEWHSYDLHFSAPEKTSVGSQETDLGSDSRGALAENLASCVTAVRNTLGIDPQSDIGQRYASTLFIQWARSGFDYPLMSQNGTGDENAEPQADEDQLEALRMYRDELFPWEGAAHDDQNLELARSRIDDFIEAENQPAETAQAMLSWCSDESDHREQQAEAEEEEKTPLPF